ncbi:Uncharacterised protein [Sphingobacterium spiritivorum]|uniref:Uncharacterized protein n=1 Tax=Sphingobacterium spiritivorum TaxID=258 RepID=A0A380BJS8_SPHSI|nr:Uncharacterised protein [Sphingobacterium spiritivorum]
MINESWIRRYGEGMYADPGDMVQVNGTERMIQNGSNNGYETN